MCIVYTLEEKHSSDCLRNEENSIVVTVFLLIMSPTEVRVWFIIKRETLTTVVFLSIRKELEKDFSECTLKMGLRFLSCIVKGTDMITVSNRDTNSTNLKGFSY